METPNAERIVSPALSYAMSLQLEGRGVLDAARQMLRSEGPAAFFRSYRTTLVMNVPFTAMHFSVYETAKKIICHDGKEGK